jgi:Leucine-rich repeat (LRR) protein
LTNLEDVDLSLNRLTQIPPEIGQLTRLKRLQIAGNNFATLPPEVEELRAKGVDVIP